MFKRGTNKAVGNHSTRIVEDGIIGRAVDVASSGGGNIGAREVIRVVSSVLGRYKN